MTGKDVLPPEDIAPRDPRQPADFQPVPLARMLLRTARIASLGTLDPASGHPLVTLASVATDLDGSPVILVSRLSHHTQNLIADHRASILLAPGGKGDPLAHPRLTLQGAMEITDAPSVRRRFLARHPKAKLYVDFPDFAFFRLRLGNLHLNGGFARAFDGEARLILAEIPEWDAFDSLEQEALDHMNGDHAETLTLYATRLCGMGEGKWRASGLDPHGIDLALGDLTARVEFEEPVHDPFGLRRALKFLADKARETKA